MESMIDTSDTIKKTACVVTFSCRMCDVTLVWSFLSILSGEFFVLASYIFLSHFCLLVPVQISSGQRRAGQGERAAEQTKQGRMVVSAVQRSTVQPSVGQGMA